MQLRTAVISISAIVFLLTVAVPVGIGAEAPQIGTLNFQKLFENSAGGQAVKDQVNSEGQRLEQDLKQRADAIKAIEERLARDTGVMSKEARDEQRWELERKIEDINSLKRNYERRIQDLQMRLINEVRQGVLQVVAQYGEQKGYVLIVEDISVIYAAPHLDITDEILKRYNDYYASRGNRRQGPGE